MEEVSKAGEAESTDSGTATLLAGAVQLLSVPLSQVAEVLSNLIRPYISHSKLVIVADDDVEQPRREYGDVSPRGIPADADLASLRSDSEAGALISTRHRFGAQTFPVVIAMTETRCLVVLIGGLFADGPETDLLNVVRVAALRIGQQTRDATPGYLLGSRMSSRMRAEAVAELTDIHSTTLESLLAVLRSTKLDDAVARTNATNVAAEAIVQLRSRTDQVRTATEEAVTTAFERLQNDLRPVVDYRNLHVQFVEPPVDGRALPSEVAFGARAIVRSAILASIDQQGVSRIRVQWDCDGTNLLIGIRDDGPGVVSDKDAGKRLQDLRDRVLALNGQMTINATSGWGLEITVVMPLDPPPARGADLTLHQLSPAELKVFQRLATGMRNRAIATDLGISDNTVKFHLSRIYRKIGVGSRAEAITIASNWRSGDF